MMVPKIDWNLKLPKVCSSFLLFITVLPSPASAFWPWIHSDDTVKVHANSPCSDYFYNDFKVRPYSLWDNNAELFNARDTSYPATKEIGLGGGIEIAIDKGFCTQLLHLPKTDKTFAKKCINIITAIKEGIQVWMDRHPYLYVNWTNPITDTSKAEVIIATEQSPLLDTVYGTDPEDPTVRHIQPLTIAYATFVNLDPETGKDPYRRSTLIHDIRGGTENFTSPKSLFRGHLRRGLIVFNTDYRYYRSDDDYEVCSKIGIVVNIFQYLAFAGAIGYFYMYYRYHIKQEKETSISTDEIIPRSASMNTDPSSASAALSTDTHPPADAPSRTTACLRFIFNGWSGIVFFILYLLLVYRIIQICPDSALNYDIQLHDWKLLFRKDMEDSLYFKEKRCVNIKHVAAHEFGHLLGLNHADDGYQLQSVHNYNVDAASTSAKDYKLSPKTYIDIYPEQPCRKLMIRRNRETKCQYVRDPEVCNRIQECLYYDNECRNEYAETLMASYSETRYNHVPSYTYRKRNETIITEDDLASLFFLYPSIYRSKSWGLNPIPLEDYSLQKLYVVSEDEYDGICTTHLVNLTRKRYSGGSASSSTDGSSTPPPEKSIGALRHEILKYDNSEHRQQIIECLKEQKIKRAIHDLGLLITANCDNRPVYYRFIDIVSGRTGDCTSKRLLYANLTKALDVIQEQRTLKNKKETETTPSSSAAAPPSPSSVVPLQTLINDIKKGKEEIEEELVDGPANTFTGNEDMDRMIDFLKEGSIMMDQNNDGILDNDKDNDGLPDSIDDNIDILLEVLHSVGVGQYDGRWETKYNLTFTNSTFGEDENNQEEDGDGGTCRRIGNSIFDELLCDPARKDTPITDNMCTKDGEDKNCTPTDTGTESNKDNDGDGTKDGGGSTSGDKEL